MADIILDAKIDNKSIRVNLDTGSSIKVISSNESMDHEEFQVKVKLDLGYNTFELLAIQMHLSTVDLILGLNFMKEYKIVANLTSKYIYSVNFGYIFINYFKCTNLTTSCHIYKQWRSMPTLHKSYIFKSLKSIF